MAVTAWRLAHWIRWRQYHFPMDTYGHTVGVGLFWAWYDLSLYLHFFLFIFSMLISTRAGIGTFLFVKVVPW